MSCSVMLGEALIVDAFNPFEVEFCGGEAIGFGEVPTAAILFENVALGDEESLGLLGMTKVQGERGN